MAGVRSGMAAFLADCGVTDHSRPGENRLYEKTAGLLYRQYAASSQMRDQASQIDRVIGHATNAMEFDEGLLGVPFPADQLHSYRITQALGWRTWTRPPRPHDGIDISGSGDRRLVAAVPGFVLEKRISSSLYGRCLAIQSNLTFQGKAIIVFYAHLADWAPGIQEGMSVSLGQFVGIYGNSAGGGNPSATMKPHLHYEVRLGRNDKLLAWNPRKVFKGLDKIPFQSSGIIEYESAAAARAAHRAGGGDHGGD